MKSLFFTVLCLFSFSSFAVETSIIMKDVQSSGFCVDNLGGKFLLKIQEESIRNEIEALVPDSLCKVDSKYKPIKYKEIELVNIGNDETFYIRKVTFEETTGVKNLLLSFKENDLKKFSPLNKKIIETWQSNK